MHYAFYSPSDPYNWDGLPSDTWENARETRKKRCPILFRFRAATKCFSAGIIGGYWVIFF